jgi:hypothetical protein
VACGPVKRHGKGANRGVLRVRKDVETATPAEVSHRPLIFLRGIWEILSK